MARSVAKKKAKAPPKIGRPSKFTDALAQKIVDALVEGRSLRQVCKDEGMPNRATVIRWLDESPAFATKYARAREAQADAMDDLILETAEATTPETATADRVKIDAYKWRAAKLKPKVYGDKIQHADADGEKLPAPQFIIQPVTAKVE